jgi:hypothetical protein
MKKIYSSIMAVALFASALSCTSGGNTNDAANILFRFGAAVNAAGCPAVGDFGLTHPVN